MDVDVSRFLVGLELRYTLTDWLSRFGVLSVGRLVALVEGEGFVIDGRASKVVSDALRWEVRRGRVVRLARGVYGPGSMPRQTRSRIRRRVAELRARAARAAAATAETAATVTVARSTGGKNAGLPPSFQPFTAPADPVGSHPRAAPPRVVAPMWDKPKSRPGPRDAPKRGTHRRRGAITGGGLASGQERLDRSRPVDRADERRLHVARPARSLRHPGWEDNVWYGVPGRDRQAVDRMDRLTGALDLGPTLHLRSHEIDEGQRFHAAVVRAVASLHEVLVVDMPRPVPGALPLPELLLRIRAAVPPTVTTAVLAVPPGGRAHPHGEGRVDRATVC